MSTASPHNLIRSQIADIPLAELAAQEKTPFYVYDEKKIIERIGDLKAFDVVRYAQKACSNLAILDLCRRHGAVVDAVSAGEIFRAEAAGFSFTGDVADVDMIKMAQKDVTLARIR